MSSTTPPTPVHRPIFLELSEGFADAVSPANFPRHLVRFRNDAWAKRIGLDGLDEQAWRDRFARFLPFEGNLPEPLAIRYHGHQFRSYNPELGDGRGFLYAQFEDLEDGRILDLATKGSGQTPYSRQGDGRLTLKGGVREILATEMLEALGVYTSKTFSVIETGESLTRYDEPSPTRACVLTRLGHSHIRFGCFQRHAFEKRFDRVEELMRYTVRHYMPSCLQKTTEHTALAFLTRVTHQTAALCAQWLAAGFVHGVLNTDNMNVNGESFDYGPWRFLPTLDPNFVAAYFDQTGLYRYGNQPGACLWNLSRLAETLLEFAPVSALTEVLQQFDERLWVHVVLAYMDRLGVASRGDEEDDAFIKEVLEFLQESGMPYQQFFFDWYGGGASASRAAGSPAGEFYDTPKFASLRKTLRRYEPVPEVDLSHAYWQDRATPCDMLIDEVEAIWAPIAEQDDWSLLSHKIEDLRLMGQALGHGIAR